MRLVAEIPTLGWLDVLFRLAVAAGLGAAIGLERELDEKAAGLRTHMLVSLGSALFTMVGAYGFEDFARGGVTIDPSRIAAQVVTGIGFLGAGVIFRQGFTIRGLTTAASLWVVAAVGMAAGAGFWKGAVVGSRRRDRQPPAARVAEGAHDPAARGGSLLGRARRARVGRAGDRGTGKRGRSARSQPRRRQARDRGADRPRPARAGAGEDRRPRRRPGSPLAKLILCSRNEHKLLELRAALPEWEIDPLEADDYPEESADTYEENARGKARYGRAVAPADVWVVGEDAGIEVEALGWGPGPRSARWSDRPLERRPRERIRRPGALPLHDGGDRPRRPGGRRRRHARRLDRRRRARRRGVRLRPDLRPGRRGLAPSPSSATSGSRATRPAPARRRRYGRRSPRRSDAAGARRAGASRAPHPAHGSARRSTLRSRGTPR